MTNRRHHGPCQAILALFLAAVTFGLAAGAASAQTSPALVDGAVYLGLTPRGRTLTAIVERAADGTAAVILLEEPPGPGGAPGLDLALAAPVERQEERLLVAGPTRRRTGASPTARVELRLPLAPDGALDPHGTAEAVLRDLPAEIAPGLAEGEEVLAMRGVGTLLAGRTETADGALRIERRAPVFLADPWRALDVFALARLEADEQVAAGLQHLRAPEGPPIGGWSDERTVRIQSLGPGMVSFLVEIHVYAGGAHPNTDLLARTLLADPEEGWRLASPCEALAALGRSCDPEAMRAMVIEELARQDAAWVVDGTVDADAPWLLDRTTITPSGVRVDFAPYAVGPYAQGVFTVHLPFDALP